MMKRSRLEEMGISPMNTEKAPDWTHTARGPNRDFRDPGSVAVPAAVERESGRSLSTERIGRVVLAVPIVPSPSRRPAG